MAAHRAALLTAALTAALTVAFPGAAGAEPASYRLDPDQSFVYFEVLHFGTSTLRGRFAGVSGEVDIDPAAGTGSVGLRIPTATVDTGIRVLDARLRQADLLDSQDHPEAYFVARKFRFQGEQLAEVRGEFTWRGMSQPLSLIARHYACREDRSNAVPVQVCGGDFEADFKRSDFGATFGLPFIGDNVHLKVSVEGRRR